MPKKKRRTKKKTKNQKRRNEKKIKIEKKRKEEIDSMGDDFAAKIASPRNSLNEKDRPNTPPLESESNRNSQEEMTDSVPQQTASNPPPAVGEGLPKVELEKLVDLSKETTEKLNQVWDEIGLSDEERVLQLESLIHSVENVFTQKVADEVAMRDESIEEIKCIEKEITNLSSQLGMEREQFPHPEKGHVMVKLPWLRNHLKQFQAMREERLVHLTELKTKLCKIWDELGTKHDENLLNLENFLHQDGFDMYESHLIQANHDKARREAAIQETVRDINALFSELEYRVASDLDVSIVQGGESLGIDMHAVDVLSARATELTELKMERQEKLKELGSQISPLWAKLGVPDTIRERFFEENPGLGEAVILNCEIELERLLTMKQERMGELIAAERAKIENLWDEMQYATDQRQTFLQAHAGVTPSEEILEAHEQEVSVLEMQATLYRPILKSISKYEHLCEDRAEVDATARDKSRYLSRARQGPSQLQQELARARKVEKGIPIVVERIKAAIKEYEDLHGPFELNGKSYRETLEENEAAYLAQKEAEKEEKKAKKAAGKAGNTRGPVSKRAPLGTRNSPA